MYFFTTLFFTCCLLSLSQQSLHDNRHGKPVFDGASAIINDVNTKLTQNDSVFPPPPPPPSPMPDELAQALLTTIVSEEEDDEDLSTVPMVRKAPQGKFLALQRK